MRPKTRRARNRKNRRTRVYTKKSMHNTRRKRYRGGVGKKRKHDEVFAAKEELFEDLLRMYVEAREQAAKKEAADAQLSRSNMEKAQQQRRLREQFRDHNAKGKDD